MFISLCSYKSTGADSGADILNCATDSTDRREVLRRPAMNIFAERLKTLRKEKGDTQSDVGKVINVTKVGILDMEKGRAKTTIDKAVLLADYFNVSLDYLVGRTDKR